MTHFLAETRSPNTCELCGQHIGNHSVNGECPAESAAQTAPGFLRRAADIMAERAKQYDKPEGERSMGKCVAAFNIVTGHGLSEAEGWLLLQILKDVRQWQRPGFHQDSADECIAYAALKAKAKQKEARCNGR